jgi:hypothetical protein
MVKQDFRFDIFLNYSKLDGSASNGSTESWVSVFKDYMLKVTTEMLGFEPTFTENAQDKSLSAHSIHLLSDNFLKDSTALDLAEKTDFFVANKPVLLPNSLAGAYIYAFYSKKINNKEIQIYEEISGIPKNESSGFWLTLIDFCYDLRDALLKSKGLENTALRRGKVYLAQSNLDVSVERILVKNELQRYGYEVVPAFVPQTPLEVKQALSECSLSIHLIGKEYGEPLHGSDMSLVEMEAQACSQYQNTFNQIGEQKFERLVWISLQAQDLKGKQASFVHRVKKESHSENPVEVIECQIEDFRMLLLQKLAIKPSEIEADLHADLSTDLIYIMSDLRDNELSVSLRDFLNEKGYRVLMLPTETQGQIRQSLHRKYLSDCGVALICYNSAKRTWLVSKLQDILKSQGLGRKAQLPKSVVLSLREDKLLDVDELLRFYPQNSVKHIASSPVAAFEKLVSILK